MAYGNTGWGPPMPQYGMAPGPMPVRQWSPVQNGPQRPPDRGPMMAPPVGGPPGGNVRPPDRGPVNMAPGAGTPMPAYVNPTARQQQYMSQQGNIAMQAAHGQNLQGPEYDQFLAQQHEQAKANLALQAGRYATHRLDALKKVADQLPPELRAQLDQAQGVAAADPAAAWRSISAAFTAAAQQQGFQDPRMWLAQMQQSAPY